VEHVLATGAERMITTDQELPTPEPASSIVHLLATFLSPLTNRRTDGYGGRSPPASSLVVNEMWTMFVFLPLGRFRGAFRASVYAARLEIEEKRCLA
jgi:hypothetical protein